MSLFTPEVHTRSSPSRQEPLVPVLEPITIQSTLNRHLLPLKLDSKPLFVDTSVISGILKGFVNTYLDFQCPYRIAFKSTNLNRPPDSSWRVEDISAVDFALATIHVLRRRGQMVPGCHSIAGITCSRGREKSHLESCGVFALSPTISESKARRHCPLIRSSTLSAYFGKLEGIQLLLIAVPDATVAQAGLVLT
jgi:hypothetical protein